MAYFLYYSHIVTLLYYLLLLFSALKSDSKQQSKPNFCYLFKSNKYKESNNIQASCIKNVSRQIKYNYILQLNILSLDFYDIIINNVFFTGLQSCCSFEKKD